MSELQIYLALGIVLAVIVAIAFDLLDLAVATLLGTCAMVVSGILTNEDLMRVPASAGGVVALLFGGMIVARVLERSGVFEWLGEPFLRLTGGSGRRFLLLLVLVVASTCAFLPNAATVILLAPLIIRTAKALQVGFVGPMILTAIVSNAAGLLTLVGDPATFLVGNSIGMSFGEYLEKVSLGGLLAVLVIVPLLPLLMREVWNLRRQLVTEQPLPGLQRPGFALLAVLVLVFMVLMFLFGQKFSDTMGPPMVAILCASIGLFIVYVMKVEPVDDALRAVDWKTLIFLIAIMCLMEGFAKTGVLQGLAFKLHEWFGTNLTLVALALLAAVGLMSTVLANIPVVAASVVMTKGYFVAIEAVPELALSAQFDQWPAAAIPAFVAMMFGGTLGGNATMIGASANVVCVGICDRAGDRVSFARFARYGVPITLAQLAVGAVYVLMMLQMVGG